LNRCSGCGVFQYCNSECQVRCSASSLME
jgi:hypothetical protein